MFSVTKEFSFDSAHRLVQGYEGKCSNIHGHTWRVRFTEASDCLDRFGFVRDFGEFKRLKKLIDDSIDHATLVSIEDKVLIAFLNEHKQKYVTFNENPTSEYLAKFFFEIAHNMGVHVTAVEVDETCTSSARYTL
jgi:6-pyruvoyltetrahydropterin/6-carboxytetrahydropterin synthase